MFSSYGGASSRSKSTTDIFLASTDLDDASYPPAEYSRFRKYTNPGMVNHRRRIAVPVPPRRSDNSFTVDLEASSPKVSYLTDNDVCLEPDPGQITVRPTQLSQSPGSKNFVKKLVATLERRQREQQLGFLASSRIDLGGNELVHKKNLRNTVPGTKAQEISREQECVARFTSEQIVSRLPATQLEDLHERDENEDEEDWQDSSELTPQFWENDEDSSSPITTKSLPIHIIERKADSNNNPTKTTTVKRTLKNMLSSLLSWKNAKSLPKGSREYYSARESLGEEMRAFRRDTMPRLMEHASVKEKLGRNEQQREFSELIGSPKSNLPEERSIATIHPVYGSSSSNQRRSWHKQDFPEAEPEVVYGSIKVQPPIPPPRASSQLSPTSEPRHVLRPSKIQELQKRITRQSESYSQVQLRRTAETVKIQQQQQRNSIVYDVPRSNRRVDSPDTADVLVVERERVPGYINRVTPPEYANVSGIIATHDDDKRLHCTAFTTF